jgi:hypothetical protein
MTMKKEEIQVPFEDNGKYGFRNVVDYETIISVRYEKVKLNYEGYKVQLNGKCGIEPQGYFTHHVNLGIEPQGYFTHHVNLGIEPQGDFTHHVNLGIEPQGYFIHHVNLTSIAIPESVKSINRKISATKLSFLFLLDKARLAPTRTDIMSAFPRRGNPCGCPLSVGQPRGLPLQNDNLEYPLKMEENVKSKNNCTFANYKLIIYKEKRILWKQ